MKKLAITTGSGTRFRGVSAVARKVGVTSQHLSMCLHGVRKPGKALARKLQRYGVECGEVAK